MRKLVIILFTLISAAASAQDIPEADIYKVHINGNQGDIIAEIKPVATTPKTEPDKTYYWFNANSIKQTQGGYSGHLLNGQYQECYPNKTLKIQGSFNKGLKNGIWKNWSINGVLQEETNWKNGLRNGKFTLYDENGDIKKQGSYQNDMIAPKTSSFWSRLNIFKKKVPTTNQ